MNERRQMRHRAVRSRRSRGESGAVAVEFALIVPILAMLLMGIVTGGLTYSNAIGLSNAVREGARFGATRVYDSGWANAVNTRTRDTQFDDTSKVSVVCMMLYKNATTVSAVPTTAVQAATCLNGTNSAVTVTNAPALSTLPAVEANQCVSVVWAMRGFSMNWVLGAKTGTLVRTSTALYERSC